MAEKATDELDKMLENMKPSQLKDYYKNNSEYLAQGEKAFYYYMKDVIDARNIRLKDIYIQIGVDEKWGGKILRMERKTKNRDMIIMMCIAAHFLIEEINRALKLYGMPQLYAKDKRDACIIVAVRNRKYNIDDINELLQENGFEPLSAKEKQ